MKRLDWFVAKRQLSEDVAEFMRCFVWRTELNLRYAGEIEKCNTAIEKLSVLEGSIHEDQIPTMKTSLLARIAELEKERDAAIAEQATFEVSEAGKKLRTALRKNPASADVAIYEFFDAYGLDVRETGLAEEILNAAGEKIDKKTIVKTNAETVTAFNSANAFKMVYAKAYEHMVYAGTIKATQIPELMRERYTSIKEKKAAGKAAKKAAAKKN